MDLTFWPLWAPRRRNTIEIATFIDIGFPSDFGDFGTISTTILGSLAHPSFGVTGKCCPVRLLQLRTRGKKKIRSLSSSSKMVRDEV